ncbi:fluoride efflux transporter CrcB [Nitrogeniibacter mangrovi]|uniref:Fluoride-specific ion channel FluC n=1 Tax=Nitrogeniibacter mangrovi TaxID=2016596 RepID=A0A6C1B675_9RHOO|nr:fluoride efflux transporter CrcB [Nitrogeniibacter mangrovi]QID18957.1 fluoride efflux transporter CrcB [Nitrogeniibacter mangrovi]
MNPSGFLAVGLGAALGAWIRWWLGVRLNPVFVQLPLGTLAANLLGAYLIGLAVAFFAHQTALPPEVRWFAVTGFLGALTTFSTFSAEVVTMIGAGQYGWAALTASVHLGGSLLMTGVGIFTFQFIVRA